MGDGLSQAAARDARQVGWWLAAFGAMVFAMILIGGATRLTESGLSITEWKPVTGVLPPLSHGDWVAEFQKYKRIPQFERLNAGMTLDGFRRIYLWEYSHRLAARVVGLALVLPFAWFLVRRRMPAFARARVTTLVVLLLAQAGMGWWMVVSGLTERTEVSQYRLAAHLLLAFVLLALTVWTAADLLEGRRRRDPGGRSPLARPLGALAALVFVTAGSGALVAGLRAGRIYNTFPMMGSGLVPVEYGQLAPWWRNLFENHAAVQFNHRVLAVTTFAAVLGVALLARRAAARDVSHARVSGRMAVACAVATLQVALGIATLLLRVPVHLGVAHQGGAALLLVVVLLAWHADGARTMPAAPAIPRRRTPSADPVMTP